MKSVLRDMIEIFEPSGVDWMGFHKTRDNKYTYHHINEKRNSGKVTIDNGAILTKDAHRLLHILECKFPEAYVDYQNLFRYINDTREPLNNDLIEDIYGMLLDLLYYQEYGDVDSVASMAQYLPHHVNSEECGYQKTIGVIK